MPTLTFDKLLPEKRDKIVNAAIGEFATHVFAEANLDRIAADAGVSKGSLFQYFADKTEFYIYAVESALERTWEFYQKHIELNPPQDCFAMLVEAVLCMAALKQQAPHLAALYLRVVYAKDSHSREKLYEKYVDQNNHVFERMIGWGIEDGLIDPKIPDAVVRFHMHAVGSHLIYLVLSGDDPRWLPQGPRRLRKFVLQTAEVLQQAMAPRDTNIKTT